jgi:hypothetical protein
VSNVAGEWFDRMRKLGVPGPELLLFGPAQAVQLAATAARAALVGRRRTFQLGGRTVAAEVVDLAVDTGVGLALGQFEGVRLDLRDVEWEGRRVTTLRVHGRNVHQRPGLTPTFVTAPVLVTATIDQDALPTWSTRWTERFHLEIGDDSIARIHLRDHVHRGALEVDVRVDDGILVVDPSAVRAGHRRFTVPRRVPPLRLPIVLPRGVRLTSVSLEPRTLRVEAMVPEWSEPLVITDVQRFARLLTPDLDPVIVPLRPR